MKFFSSLLSITIVSVVSVNANVVLSKTNGKMMDLSSDHHPEKVTTLAFFKIIQDVIETVEDVNEAVEDVNEVVDTINSFGEAERRRKELEAARQAATEQERLEAERRQQYFESLSPEDQQAYIERQQAMQAQRDQAANLFMLMMLSSMFANTGSSVSSCTIYSPISGHYRTATWEEIPTHDRQYASCY